MMVLTIKAIKLAKKAHKGQFRKVSGLPYIVHPLEVLSIVKKYKESHNIDAICAAAVLHDTAEDAGLTYEALSAGFGTLTASLIMEVTNDTAAVSKLGKLTYINEKLLKLTSYALVIKLADMLANVTDNPAEKTIKRIAAHVAFLRANRVLSATQLKLAEQIEYSIENLYS